MQTRHCETLANHHPDYRRSALRDAHRVLEALNASTDPLLLRLSHAPIDDEPETDAEREAVTRAHDDIREGKTLSQDEVRRKLRRA
jgi:hypothetical protein